MNRRGFLKLVAAAAMAPYLPDIVAPEKVLYKFGPLTASQMLGQWLVEKIEEDLINALCGL